ncbi:MAG TPA: TetR/AcrR family transcriptional regulator [Acidimicrobiales bacterium]|nr:TetR/AcrR family transcriptional regulator [Acidimicrobiales bacterium]
MEVKGLRARHAEETRRALVEAATGLFAAAGYADTSTEEVVARAGVTRGALYHHFGSKQGLFQAVLEAVHADLIERLVGRWEAGGLAEGGDVWDQVRAGCQAYLDACLDPTYQRIALVDAPAVLTDQGASTGLVGLELLEERIEEAMEAGLIGPMPVGPLAGVLGAALHQASLLVAQSPAPERARQEVGVIVDRLLEGLRAGPA